MKYVLHNKKIFYKTIEFVIEKEKIILKLLSPYDLQIITSVMKILALMRNLRKKKKMF